MNCVIRDTGLDNLIRVLSKQDSAPSARKSQSWPRSSERRSGETACERIAAIPGSPRTSLVVEKGVVWRPSNDAIDSLERGVIEDVVGWDGPEDPEVLFKFPRVGIAD